jgi:2-polyprenyl-6-methoxyphenol hydroxylase-like FAD-dependent oxidoreductase
MAESGQADGILPSESDYDAVVVGASLAGCATAIMLGRSGARVALLEQRPDPAAYKRVCSHYIQSSAVATLERLGLLEPMMRAGALRSRARIWTRWGWIEPSQESSVPSGINLRRERLDPIVRELAAETDGVELLLGQTVTELVREDGRVCGVRARSADGETVALAATLVVGADGRGSRVAKLSGVRSKSAFHGRFAYGGYFEGPVPAGHPDASLWMLDPDMAAAFPTDDGLTFYAVMPTKKRLPEFRADPASALKAFVAEVPDAPPILDSRQVGAVQGKLDMTNVAHVPTAPGLALVGDAALAIDPLWGVGCGWAFQSAEWLADSVAPSLGAAEGSRADRLEHGLRRYRRRHSAGLRGHATMIRGYASGRRMNAPERLLFSAATRSERVGRAFEAFGSRNIGPARMMALALPSAVAVTSRHSLRRGPDAGATAVAQPS